MGLLVAWNCAQLAAQNYQEKDSPRLTCGGIICTNSTNVRGAGMTRLIAGYLIFHSSPLLITLITFTNLITLIAYSP